MSVSHDKIMKALAGVSGLEPGMIAGVQEVEGHVVVMIEVDPAKGAALEPMRQQAERAVAKLSGIKKVTAILTAERAAQAKTDKNPVGKLEIKNLIAVASGKGGVGKSTVAANLAMALARAGYRTGLLDADIYGPSQPLMMGLKGCKPDGEEGKINPLEAHGVKVMSIGFMVKDEAPLIWRGPMVQSAIVQLLRDVEWGALDYLIIDLPPGTGDAQLTMAQKVPLTGAVIVSTPQDIALLDARKGLEMFRKVNVRVFGMIENMSTHVCSNCGHEEHIFGHGGAKKEAEKLGVPFLGEIPLSIDIRVSGDEGRPAVQDVFDGIAARVIAAQAQET